MNTENPVGTPETIVTEAPITASETQPTPKEKKARKPRDNKKLTKHFFKAGPRAQVSSLWRAWNKKDTTKIEEFKALLASGAASISGPLTKCDTRKLTSMGFTLPEGLEIKARKPRVKKEKPAAEVKNPPAEVPAN